jgi:hypothetical protein
MTKKTVHPTERSKRMNVEYDNESEEEEVVEQAPAATNRRMPEKIDTCCGDKKKTEPKSGLNWTAFAILCMFALPLLLGGALQAMDFFYPEAAKERQFRDKIMRCYEVANPSKVSEVDKFVERYKGRENVLFAQLRNKYPKKAQCQF